jgi:hypothetical protein
MATPKLQNKINLPTTMKKNILVLQLLLFLGMAPTITAQNVGKLTVSTTGLKANCKTSRLPWPPLRYENGVPIFGPPIIGNSDFPVTMDPFQLEFGTPGFTGTTGAVTYYNNFVPMDADGLNFTIWVYGDSNYPEPNDNISDVSTTIKFSDAIMPTWTGASLTNCFGTFTFTDFVPNFSIKTTTPNDCVNNITRLTTEPSNIGNDGAVVAKYANWQFSVDAGVWVDFPVGFNGQSSPEFKIYDLLKASNINTTLYINKPIQFRLGNSTDGSFSNTPLTIAYTTCGVVAQNIYSRQNGCPADTTIPTVDPGISVEFNRTLNTDETISLSIFDTQPPGNVIATATDVIFSGKIYTFAGNNLQLEHNHTYILKSTCKTATNAPNTEVANTILYYADADNARKRMTYDTTIEQETGVGTGIRTLELAIPTAITITGTAQKSTKIGTPANGKIITFAVTGGTAICTDVYYHFTWTRTDKNNKTDIISYPDSETVTDNITNITTTNLINLSAGTYKVVIKDKYGCSVEQSYVITEPEPIVVTISKTNDVLCFNDASGALKVDTTTGGLLDNTANPPGSYSYEWYKQETNLLFTATGNKGITYDKFKEGIYKVKATDNFTNSGWSNEITIKPAVEITATPTPTHVLCNGGNTGSISLAIAGGSTKDKNGVEKGYTVTWLDGAIIQNRTGLGAGTYSYTITDALGCKYNNGNLTPVTIIQPNPIIIAISSQTPPSSATSTDGTLTLNVSGGTGAYTYFLKKGTNPEVSYTSNPITGLNGTYTLRVKDANGCSKDYPDSIAIVTLTVSKTMQTDVLCKGDPTSTGSITVLASGGTPKFPDPKYTYQWYKGTIKLTGEIYPTITGLSIGTYKVTVTDANRTIDSDPFIITQPTDPLTVTSSALTQQQPVSCYGGSDGAIQIIVAGGTGAYTYLWNDNYTGKDRTGLSKGTYTVTVTDANQCAQTLNGIIITEPLPISIPNAIPTTNVTVFGQSTGALTLPAGTPTEGNGGYTYKWTSTTDVNFGTKYTRDLTGLKAGFYTLEVRDAKANVVNNEGCIATQTFEVTQNPELKVAITETKFIKCNGDANGELQAVVNGGVGPYSYSWIKNTKSIAGATSTQTVMGFGDYTVKVTDSFGATKTATVYTLAQPETLSVAVVGQPTNILCNGASTGAIAIKIDGGTPPYTQQWTKDGANYATDKDLVNLLSGMYNVIVKDALGHDCTATLSNSVEIKQPLPLVITDDFKNDLKGFETANGAISVTLSGGVSPYTYSWRNKGVATIIGAQSKIENLPIGNYILTVTDKNACAIVSKDYVLSQPPKLEIKSIVQKTGTDILCNGQKTGILQATVIGGAPIDPMLTKNYSYNWYEVSNKTISVANTNPTGLLGAGFYALEVTDVNGNVATSSTLEIKEPLPLAFTSTTTNVTCKDFSNGKIQLNITGGKGNKTIICNPTTVIINADNSITGLKAGDYVIYVQDQNGCKTTKQTITINEPTVALAFDTNIITTPTTGFNKDDGSVTVAIVGGTSPYAYTWDKKGTVTNTQTTSTNAGLKAGAYVLNVTDAKGCTISDTYTVEEPTKPVLTETHLQAKCNGLQGSLVATADGGATFGQNQTERTYTYKLKNTATSSVTTIEGNTANFNTIADGDYQVTATDSGGIDSNTITVNFKQPEAITLTPSQTNVNCNEGSDGTASVEAKGGTGLYTYIWKKGTVAVGTNSPTIGGLQLGDYTVEVRDDNYSATDTTHCVASASFTITQPTKELTIASSSKTDITGFGLKNGTITVTVEGGTPNYVYTWTKVGDSSFVSTNSNAITGLDFGNYKLVVTDKNKVCSVEEQFEIGQPDLLKITTSTTPIKCYGNPTGALQASATGGIQDKDGFYTYKLFDVNKVLIETQLSKTVEFKTLFAGDYYIQVTDTNGNKTPQDLNLAKPIVLSQPAKALTITEIGKTNATCPREADGTITIEVSGGTTPYTYVWKNIDKNTNTGNTASINNLIKGNYEVTVTDFNNCEEKASFVITEPEDFGFDKERFTLTKPTATNPNWSVNVVMIGGQNDYKYSVKASNGVEIRNVIINSKSLLLENLPKDAYYISVTDNTGCTKSETIDLLGNVLDVKFTQTKQIICNGDGANFTATATGGTGLLYYAWFKDGVVLTNETTSSISDYGPGTYKVYVIDSDKVEVRSESITVKQPDQVKIIASSAVRPSCFGVKDGVVNLTATGGNGAYQYSYETGKWFAFSNQSETIVEGLSSGTHTFYVKDTNGCIALAKQEVIVPETPLLQITNPIITPATGFGLANGAINITAVGGNSSYKFNWYKKDGTAIDQNINSASGLLTGSYYVVLADAKNCSVTSDLFFVAEPKELLVSIDQPTTSIACFQDKSIALTAKVTGGVLNYKYQWMDANKNTISTNATTPLLGAGSYYVKIVDANKNEATSNTITITEPTLIKVANTYEAVKCHGESNGSVTLTALGGSNVFEYRFKNLFSDYGIWIPFTNSGTTICTGLKAGNYTFQIKDQNGTLCSNVPNINVTILQPTFPITIASTANTPTLRFGGNEGTATVTPQWGNGGFTYEWFRKDNSKINQTTATANKLFAGEYYAIVKDAKGCSVTSSVIEVIQPPLLLASVAMQNSILCHGSETASIKASATGGFLNPGENYTYKWFAYGTANPVLGSNAILGNLKAGDSYYVVATDSNKINALSDKITITEPTAINNYLTADYTLCGDAKDWTIATNPTQGTPPYTYIWNTGETTPTINVVAGTYYVTVSDKNGCSIKNEITLTIPAHLDASAVIKKPTCFEGSDATITVTTIDGIAPFTYLWNTGEKSNVLSNAAAKAYSVDITDARGCLITRNYTIENPPKEVITIGDDVTLCNGQSLTINATIKDDNAKYDWTADNGFVSNKPIVTIAKPGTYSLTVTNNLGCKATDAIKIESDNIDISAEFAVSTQVFVNEKIVIVDISNPQPESLEWVLPIGANVTTKNKDFAEISFAKAGEYELTLNTKRGNCTAFQTKKILVVEGEYVDPELEAKTVFDLKIYPNPSDGIFTIDVKLEKAMPVKIKLYNLTNNAIIDSKAEEGKKEYSFNFNLNGLASAVYYVLFESKQGNKLRKIIIK